MPSHTRRMFLKLTGVGAAGAAALCCTRPINAAGADDKIVVGLIGCGGRGPGVAQGTGGVAYVCDPDLKRLAAAAGPDRRLGG